jgi:hypothetical protein
MSGQLTLLTQESLVYAVSFNQMLEANEVLTDIVSIDSSPTGLLITEEEINTAELSAKGLRNETVTIPVGKAVTFRAKGDVDAVAGTYEINLVVDTNDGPAAGGNRREGCVDIEFEEC